jgi:hypothetical protein
MISRFQPEADTYFGPLASEERIRLRGADFRGMSLRRAVGLGSATKNAVVLTEAGKYLKGKKRVSTILK